jgi:hypothetical protein
MALGHGGKVNREARAGCAIYNVKQKKGLFQSNTNKQVRAGKRNASRVSKRVRYVASEVRNSSMHL